MRCYKSICELRKNWYYTFGVTDHTIFTLIYRLAEIRGILENLIERRSKCVEFYPHTVFGERTQRQVGYITDAITVLSAVNDDRMKAYAQVTNGTDAERKAAFEKMFSKRVNEILDYLKEQYWW